MATKERLKQVYDDLQWQLNEYDEAYEAHGEDSKDIISFNKFFTKYGQELIEEGVLPASYSEEIEIRKGKKITFVIDPVREPYDFLDHGYFDLRKRLGESDEVAETS